MGSLTPPQTVIMVTKKPIKRPYFATESPKRRIKI